MGFLAKQDLTYSLREYDIYTLAHQKKKLLLAAFSTFCTSFHSCCRKSAIPYIVYWFSWARYLAWSWFQQQIINDYGLRRPPEMRPRENRTIMADPAFGRRSQHVHVRYALAILAL
jgi:hypothetical protein